MSNGSGNGNFLAKCEKIKKNILDEIEFNNRTAFFARRLADDLCSKLGSLMASDTEKRETVSWNDFLKLKNINLEELPNGTDYKSLSRLIWILFSGFADDCSRKIASLHENLKEIDYILEQEHSESDLLELRAALDQIDVDLDRKIFVTTAEIDLNIINRFAKRLSEMIVQSNYEAILKSLTKAISGISADSKLNSLSEDCPGCEELYVTDSSNRIFDFVSSADLDESESLRDKADQFIEKFFDGPDADSLTAEELRARSTGTDEKVRDRSLNDRLFDDSSSLSSSEEDQAFCCATCEGCPHSGECSDFSNGLSDDSISYDTEDFLRSDLSAEKKYYNVLLQTNLDSIKALKEELKDDYISLEDFLR